MAGAGFKTFNTGDVLTASDVNTYLMQQTVMVFADSSARSTALGANVAEGMLSYLKSDDKVYSYNGSAWVAIDTGSTSPLTTKGDLYTYSTTDARLPVGSNGYTLVADSSTSTGLAYGSSALANPVINGGMDIWQRGTSVAVSGSAAYTFAADRWGFFRGAYATGLTVSRQATGDTTNLPNIQYAQCVQRNSGNTTTQGIYLQSTFESVNSIPFAGRQVTFSFYARAGANYSATSNALTYNLASGTGTDQSLLSGFTGSATPVTGTATLTTNWQRFSGTGTISSSATQLGIGFDFTPTGTAGANDYFEVTGVQIDLGSTALPFRRSGGTIQGELAACQRYYYLAVEGTTKQFGIGQMDTNSAITGYFTFPVTMRTTPTLSATSGTNYYVGELTSGQDFFNSLTILRAHTNGAGWYNSSEISGTAGQCKQLYTNNASASIAFSAEL